MVERGHQRLSMAAQCRLLALNRSGRYYQPVAESAQNLAILRLLDAQYLKTPFYGVRKLQWWLASQGYSMNRKRLRRLMGIVGWQTIYRAPRTTIAQPGAHIHPYLLKGLEVCHSNQVWATDITYVPMAHGFMYLCAVIDLYSRYVVSWGLSNTMTAEWCTAVMEGAIQKHGAPLIVNTDQGAQFTSAVFQSVLKREGIAPSMDGRGRAIDNIFIERLWRSVKYEHIYLHAPEDGVELYQGLDQYFRFYNEQRPHQSLNGYRPMEFYDPPKGSPVTGALPGAAAGQATDFAAPESAIATLGKSMSCPAAENKLILHQNLSEQ
jgi:putative transposase